MTRTAEADHDLGGFLRWARVDTRRTMRVYSGHRSNYGRQADVEMLDNNSDRRKRLGRQFCRLLRVRRFNCTPSTIVVRNRESSAFYRGPQNIKVLFSVYRE